MSEPLVAFDNVEKRYGDVVVVRAMPFAIHRGEFLAIMEPSGCGRTINDVPVHERDTPLVWQSLALFPFLNVRENVEFGLKMKGLDTAARRARATDWPLRRRGDQGCLACHRRRRQLCHRRRSGASVRRCTKGGKCCGLLADLRGVRRLDGDAVPGDRRRRRVQGPVAGAQIAGHRPAPGQHPLSRLVGAKHLPAATHGKRKAQS